MPKTKKSFRLTKHVTDLIHKHKQMYDLKNMSEALEHMILENQTLHQYIREKE